MSVVIVVETANEEIVKKQKNHSNVKVVLASKHHVTKLLRDVTHVAHRPAT